MEISDLDPEKLRGYLHPGQNTNNRGGNKRLFEVKFTVKFESDLPPGEWDRGLINDYVRRRARQVLEAVLLDEHPDWDIKITVEGHYLRLG